MFNLQMLMESAAERRHQIRSGVAVSGDGFGSIAQAKKRRRIDFRQEELKWQRLISYAHVLHRTRERMSSPSLDEEEAKACHMWHDRKREPQSIREFLYHAKGMVLCGDKLSRCSENMKPKYTPLYKIRAFNEMEPPQTNTIFSTRGEMFPYTFLQDACDCYCTFDSSTDTYVLAKQLKPPDNVISLDTFNADDWLNCLADVPVETTAHKYSVPPTYGTPRNMWQSYLDLKKSFANLKEYNNELQQILDEYASPFGPEVHDIAKGLAIMFDGGNHRNYEFELPAVCSNSATRNRFNDLLTCRLGALSAASRAYNELSSAMHEIRRAQQQSKANLQDLDDDALALVLRYLPCRNACAALRQTCKLFASTPHIICIPRPHIRLVEATAHDGKHPGPFPHARLKDGTALCGTDKVIRIFVDFVRLQRWEDTPYCDPKKLRPSIVSQLIDEEDKEMSEKTKDGNGTREDWRTRDERAVIVEERIKKYLAQPHVAASDFDRTPVRPNEHAQWRVYGALGPKEKRVPEMRYLRLNPYSTFPDAFEYTFELVNAGTHKVVQNALEPLGNYNVHGAVWPPGHPNARAEIRSNKKRRRDADKASSNDPAPAVAEFRLRKGTLSSQYNNAKFQIKVNMHGKTSYGAHAEMAEYSEPFTSCSKLSHGLCVLNR